MRLKGITSFCRVCLRFDAYNFNNAENNKELLFINNQQYKIVN